VIKGAKRPSNNGPRPLNLATYRAVASVVALAPTDTTFFAVDSRVTVYRPRGLGVPVVAEMS
jgi:hypothetical protein